MQACPDHLARLEVWKKGVEIVMRCDRRYRSWAEDIAGDMFAYLFEREIQGSPVPEWQGVLDGEFRKVAYRIARSSRPRHVSTFDDSALLTKASEVDDSGKSCPESRLTALKGEYSSHEIEAMLRVCGARSTVTQEELAKATGRSYRTFKRSVRRLRDHRGSK
jgi:hypothetical protein